MEIPLQAIPNCLILYQIQQILLRAMCQTFYMHMYFIYALTHLILFLNICIYLFMRDTDIGRRRSRLPARAWCRTRSQDPRFPAWAGKAVAQPETHPGIPHLRPRHWGSLGGSAVWRLSLAQGAILETRDRIPRRAPGAWSLLLPLPVSLPPSLSLSLSLSLCNYHK